MLEKRLYLILVLLCCATGGYSADYALYSPDPNMGGVVGPDGTWTVSDPCFASQSFQDQT
jgi:hypothetical protein